MATSSMADCSALDDVLYLNKEEYELLRAILLDGRCSGVPIATWRKEHEICDPPSWSELVASPCCGTCHHFLLLMSVDSWLGFVKTTALVKYPGTIEDSFFDKLQQIHDLIYCKEHTKSYKASTVRVKKRVTLLFLNHLESNKFKASSKPPGGVPVEPLERLIHNAKSRQDFDTASVEYRKRQVIPEASMTLMKRREVLLDRKAGAPSEDSVVDMEASMGKLSDKKCSDVQGGPNQEYWQNFGLELERTIILVAHRLAESGVLSDSETNIVSRQRRTSSFAAFGPALNQYVRDLGAMVFPQDQKQVSENNIVREGIRIGLLRRARTTETKCEEEGEYLGESDSVEEGDDSEDGLCMEDDRAEDDDMCVDEDSRGD